MCNSKIAFIICVNNEVKYEECLFYINRLKTPLNYTIEIIKITDAPSIFQAYNMGMKSTNAKYKIYMHQDVFLFYENILCEIINIFEKAPNIGMLGLIGGTDFPQNRRFYKSWNCGNVLTCNDVHIFQNNLKNNFQLVSAIDGMFMATQYDIPWREDSFNGWDFYDFSHSLEFRKAGYDICVPPQPEPWSMHDYGQLKLTNYDNSLDNFLKIYNINDDKYITDYVYKPEYREHYNLIMQIKEEMKKLLFMGYIDSVKDTFSKIWDERFRDTELQILKNILEIYDFEQMSSNIKCSFFDNLSSFDQAYEKYLRIKYNLWRKKYIHVDTPLNFTTSFESLVVIGKYS